MAESLFWLTDVVQWCTGANIPGKVREILLYLGGFPNYFKALEDCEKGGYKEFQLS